MSKSLFWLALFLPTSFILSETSGSLILGNQKQGDVQMPGRSGLDLQELARINAVVTQYLVQQKLWRSNQFRIDHKGITADGRSVIVWAVYLEDEINPVPGGGKSLELQIDRSTMQVVKELRFQ